MSASAHAGRSSEGQGSLRGRRAGNAAADGANAARTGAALCVAGALLELATMWLLPRHGELMPAALAEVVIAALAGLASALSPRVTLPSRVLLLYPGLIGASVLATAVVSKGVGAAYTGLLTVCFIYVGLTQRRGTSLLLVPVAAPLWWYCQTTPASLSAVRLSISVTIWLIVSETLAYRTRTVSTKLHQLSDDAQTDQLTGLGNRRGLEAALESVRVGDAVVLIDLDKFKEINDTFGHQAGDRVLHDLGAVVRSVLRGEDLAFRFGGEELVIILRDGDGSVGGAVSLLQRLKERWTSTGRPTFSGGASVHRGGSPAETMQRADAALYEAKSAGRNCWRVADALAADHSGHLPE